MNEASKELSRQNRLLRKFIKECDDEIRELKRRVDELEKENRKLGDYNRTLKDELLKVMVENEELKRRTN